MESTKSTMSKLQAPAESNTVEMELDHTPLETCWRVKGLPRPPLLGLKSVELHETGVLRDEITVCTKKSDVC